MPRNTAFVNTVNAIKVKIRYQLSLPCGRCSEAAVLQSDASWEPTPDPLVFALTLLRDGWQVLNGGREIICANCAQQSKAKRSGSKKHVRKKK